MMSIGSKGKAAGRNAVRRGELLTLSSLALAVVCALPGRAHAAVYTVTDQAQLVSAINSINSISDFGAIIQLGNSFALTSSAALPSPVVPITINTQGFTLSGLSPSGSVAFAGTAGWVGIMGNIVGGGGGAGSTSGAPGLQLNTAAPSSIINYGNVTGGVSGATGGAGGFGAQLVATSFTSYGTVKGGNALGAGQGGGGMSVTRGSVVASYGTIVGGSSQAGAGGVGVLMGSAAGATSQLINYGTIKSGESLGGANNGSAVQISGVGGSIINYGTIQGATGAAAITGSGPVTVTNAGTISAGTGQANAIVMAGTRGTLQLTLDVRSVINGNVVASAAAANNVLILAGNVDTTFDVSLIGPAAQYRNFNLFQKSDTSTWSLIGTGTTATPWNIQQGILQVGNGGTSGSFIGDVRNDSTLSFKRSDAFTFGNLISGTGTVDQEGTGTVTLTGINTYTGGVIFGNGTLRVSSDANLGDAAGGLTFSSGTLNTSADISSARMVNLVTIGTFQVDAGTTLSLSGAVSGDGILLKTGEGTLALTGTNTYPRGTGINGGELRISSDANLGATSGGVGISGATLHTTADITSARSVLLSGAGTLLTDAGTTLTLTGAITGAGTLIKAGDGTLLLAGDNTYQRGTTISGGKLQLGNGGISGGLVGDVANSGTLIFNRSDSVSFDGIISGSGAVTQAGGGTTIFNGAQTYTGATTVDAGRLAVNGSITSPVTVNAAGTLGGTGTIVGNVINAGTVAPGNSIGTLTMTGNYIGQGGVLLMETALGNDSSPSDRLVVGGETSGTTHVKVVNVGGQGAQTVEGIKLVDVRGASNGNFDLIGDYLFQGQQAVVAGAYAYRLYKGGVSTPNDGDWYLRSESTQPTKPPLYAPSVPVYEAYAGVLRRLNDAGTLQQRIGGQDPASDTTSRNTGSDNARSSAAWVRVYGDHAELEPQTSTTGTHYDASTRRLQAGIDGSVHESEAGVLIAGATLQYGKVDSNVSSFYGLGRIKSTAYGIGGTLTWYGRNGLYVDAQAQWNRYDTDLTSRTLGRELVNGNKGSGYNAGIEFGQKFALSERWSLIPQGQLTYASVDFDRFTDPYGASVRSRNGDSLVARAGMAVDHERSWRSDTGGASRAHVYGIANLYYDVLHKTKASVADLNVDSRDVPLWGGLGVGGSLAWKDGRYQVYGEALAQTSLQHKGDSSAYSVRLGFRMNW